MIHPTTQKLLDYPNTAGKKIAMEHYNWRALDKVQEVMLAPQIIELSKTIDKTLTN